MVQPMRGLPISEPHQEVIDAAQEVLLKYEQHAGFDAHSALAAVDEYARTKTSVGAGFRPLRAMTRPTTRHLCILCAQGHHLLMPALFRLRARADAQLPT